MRLSKGLIQAYAVQDITFSALTTWRDDHKGEDGKLILGEFGSQVLLQLVKAWSEAQDRVRIHRNKPLPGVLKHESKPVKRKGAQAQVVVLEPMSHEDDDKPANTVDQSVDQASGQAS